MGSEKPGPCNPACTHIFKFVEDKEVGSIQVASSRYMPLDGFRFINIFVQFTMTAFDEPGVDLSAHFAFDASGTMMAHRYVNFEQNLAFPQTHYNNMVKGEGSWTGSPSNEGRYAARFPVMAPFLSVWATNRGATARKVSVWGYALS